MSINGPGRYEVSLANATCAACNRLGPYVCDQFQLPGYPHDIAEQPTHPLFSQWQWDQQFMAVMGWTWTTFYGALVEVRTGHNPNHPPHSPHIYERYD